MKIRLLFLYLLLAMSVQVAVAASPVDGLSVTRYSIDDGLSGNNVGGAVQDSTGMMWFATWNGLNCYDGYEFHRVNISPTDSTTISSNHFRDIVLGRDGRCIVCHTDEGILLFDLSTHTFRDADPADVPRMMKQVGRTWHGFTDAQGNLWTGEGNGLVKRRRGHHPASLLDGTAGQHPRALMVDDAGNLWVGLRSGRIVNIYSPSLMLLRSIGLPSSPYCIFQHSGGDIWIGCKPGALLKAGGETVADVAVYDMKEDSHGHLWVATFGDGLRVIANPASQRPVLSPSAGGRRVRKIVITDDDVLVAATTDGLLVGRINPDNPAATRFKTILRRRGDPASLSSNTLMSVAADEAGNIYVATESSGIDVTTVQSLLSATPRFTHLDIGDADRDAEIIKAVTTSADSSLIIVGNNHVTSFNLHSGQSVSYSSPFWADTCHFSEATPVSMPDGSWVFGAGQGAYIATPHNMHTRGYRLPLAVVAVSVEGDRERLWPGTRDTLLLSPEQRNVTVKFAALDYVDNRMILYHTRLDGSPWTEPDRSRSVTLFNLPPGEHTLDIQSTDHYGRWVDNTRSLTIIVKPRWFETIPARILFLLGTLAVVGSIAWVIVYIRRVNRQRRELLDKYMSLMNCPAGDAVTSSVEVTEEVPPVKPLATKPEDELFLTRVRRYIEDNISNPEANVDEMASAAATSRSTLNRRLRSLLGTSAARLLAESRLRLAEQILSDPADSRPVAEVAMACGYSDVHYFQRVFGNRCGMSPAQFRARHLSSSGD